MTPLIRLAYPFISLLVLCLVLSCNDHFGVSRWKCRWRYSSPR